MADSTNKTQIVKLHHLRPAPGAKTAKTRVGRGEGSKGKTAGRGTKGTKARYQVAAGFEGGQMPIHMRLPKLRGFKNPFRVEYQVVNVGKLGELFPEGGKVTVEDLIAKHAVRDSAPVKVLGSGELSVKLEVEVDSWSSSAEAKITAAGGSSPPGGGRAGVVLHSPPPVIFARSRLKKVVKPSLTRERIAPGVRGARTPSFVKYTDVRSV